MTRWEGCRSIGINYLQVLKNLRVESLAEISRFAAGLMQSVPKKTNELKADLQNSTAFLKVTVVGKILYRSFDYKGYAFSAQDDQLVWISLDWC